MINPIFIFSLPRAGSTLLQRLLMAHKDVSSVSEPWILLPYLYTLKNDGYLAEYNSKNLKIAIDDFIGKLPNKRNYYINHLRTYILNLYNGVCDKEAKYFLDKTPRYHLIIPEIAELFPDAKFIFLFRNPVAIIASIIETFGHGKFNLYDFHVDLYKGLLNLIKGYELLQNRSIVVSYENLVTNTEFELTRILNYLELDDKQVKIDFLEDKLLGRMGDPKAKKYNRVENKTLDKWKLTICNPYRINYCKRYLKWIGEDSLDLMGYSFNQLLIELNSIHVSQQYMAKDLIRSSLGSMMNLMEIKNIRDKIKCDWRIVYK